MLGEAIGAIMTPAIAVALTPFALIAVAIFLPGPSGMRNGALYTLGWVLGLSIAALAFKFLFDETVGDKSSSSTVMDLLRIVAGAGLIALGVKKVVKRIGSSGPAEEPRWLKSLEGASAMRAAMLGLLSSGANPKILVFTASAISSVVDTGATGWTSIAAVAVYVLIGSIGAIGLLLVAVIGGDKASGFIGSVRTFMVANMDIIVALISLLLGASILGDGIAGIRD